MKPIHETLAGLHRSPPPSPRVSSPPRSHHGGESKPRRQSVAGSSRLSSPLPQRQPGTRRPAAAARRTCTRPNTVPAAKAPSGSGVANLKRDALPAASLRSAKSLVPATGPSRPAGVLPDLAPDLDRATGSSSGPSRSRGPRSPILSRLERSRRGTTGSGPMRVAAASVPSRPPAAPAVSLPVPVRSRLSGAPGQPQAGSPVSPPSPSAMAIGAPAAPAAASRSGQKMASTVLAPATHRRVPSRPGTRAVPTPPTALSHIMQKGSSSSLSRSPPSDRVVVGGVGSLPGLGQRAPAQPAKRTPRMAPPPAQSTILNKSTPLPNGGGGSDSGGSKGWIGFAIAFCGFVLALLYRTKIAKAFGVDMG